MTTDTSEKGLETLIMRHMTGTDFLAVAPNMVAERPPPYGGTGYTAGSSWASATSPDCAIDPPASLYPYLEGRARDNRGKCGSSWKVGYLYSMICRGALR